MNEVTFKEIKELNDKLMDKYYKLSQDEKTSDINKQFYLDLGMVGLYIKDLLENLEKEKGLNKDAQEKEEKSE